MLASLFLKLFLLGIAAQLVTCMHGGGLCLTHVSRTDFFCDTEDTLNQLGS